MASVDEPVRLAAYDPEWPRHFRSEADRLRESLGDVLGIEHIGSTAVPGLTAKSIVDVMVGVADLGRANLADRLEALDYEDCGGVEGRRYFRRRPDGCHFNVQVVEYSSPLWQANLLLRDFLRSHPHAARRYSAAKLAAAETAPMLLAYSELKSPLIKELLDEAGRWES